VTWINQDDMVPHLTEANRGFSSKVWRPGPRTPTPSPRPGTYTYFLRTAPAHEATVM